MNKSIEAGTPRNENEIRDYLAKHLDLIEPGLTLIDKEQCLPNDRGAKGFIDLFAQSKSGQLVIIEIKRSDAAARQCLHELSKYAALIRDKLLVKYSEFRLIVLSTEWHELLIPFAEFAHMTRYNCAGYKIEVGGDGLPVSVGLVTLPDLPAPRRVSGRHFIWEFTQETKARRAIPIIAAHMQKVGLQDFVILLMKVTVQQEGTDYWFVYFAQQRLTFDAYMTLIKQRFSGEALEEFEAWLEDIPELEDKTEEAADKVWEGTGRSDGLFHKVKPDGSQISHPEKARYWFDSDRLQSVHINRYGRFDDPLLKDETIIAELVGSGGESATHLDTKARFSAKPEIDALITASDNIMYFNSVWRNSIRDLCVYAEKGGADSLHLKAFCNDDVLRTIAGLAIGYQRYMPLFSLDVQFGSRIETFIGTIEWNGTAADFDVLIRKHFDGDEFTYSMMVHLGANRSINADIMDDLGLEYIVGRVNEGDYSTVRVQGSTIREFRKANYKRIGEFVSENEEFAHKVVDMLANQEQEFQQLLMQQMFDSAEREMESRCEVVLRDDFWLSPLTVCDGCKRPFDQADFMIDGGLTKGGPWGCYCAACFLAGHGETGWGKGQLYRKTPEGWRLVAGGPPTKNDE